MHDCIDVNKVIYRVNYFVTFLFVDSMFPFRYHRTFVICLLSD